MVLIALIALASATVSADVADRAVDILEQRWRSLEYAYQCACVAGDHTDSQAIMREVQDLLGAVHILRQIAEGIAMPDEWDAAPGAFSRSRKEQGVALMWDGTWNALGGTLFQVCVSPINGDSGAILRAIAIIWKIYGIAQIGLGGIQLISSVFALPRPPIAERLALLEEDIEIFVATML